MGKWINMEGTDDTGRHACRPPWILGGPFGPGIGARWQCDCGDQWEIVRKVLDDPKGHTVKQWARKLVDLTRDEVLNRVTVVLPAHAGSDERARWYAEQTLAALERLHLSVWQVGGKVAKRAPAP